MIPVEGSELVLTTAVIMPISRDAYTLDFLPDLILLPTFREHSRFTAGKVRVGQ